MKILSNGAPHGLSCDISHHTKAVYKNVQYRDTSKVENMVCIGVSIQI